MKKLILLSVLLFCVSKGWGVDSSTFTYKSDYTTATVRCELCGETTVYFNSYVYHSYDYTPVRFYDNPDGWIKEYDNYYHKDCWQKFQKFLIELFRIQCQSKLNK